MDKKQLKQIITDQQTYFRNFGNIIDRKINLEYYMKGKEAVLISGIRRCGKSTLLKLISKQTKEKILYVNFDDIRLSELTIDNYQDIENIGYELNNNENITYFFDEIQIAPKWEIWINNLHSKDKKVFLTGSNSKLLSSETSTYLTGRNKTLNLYPFSFKEFLNLNQFDNPDLKSISTEQKNKILHLFDEYLENGGFPVVCINKDIELSRQYFEDILIKDIQARYNLRQSSEINTLAVYLLSNTGRTYSYSTLKSVTGIKSLSTIKKYIDWMKNTFLIYTIDKFDYSLRKQKVSSSKPYSTDNSFLKTISANFSNNKGRKLENLAFLELKRRGEEIFYYSGKKECDFIIKKGLKAAEAIQVCFDAADPKTKEKEIQGLLEAMNKYKLQKGLILTYDNEETLEIKNKKIILLPVWKWILENK